jgi:beta-galactosidase GanA
LGAAYYPEAWPPEQVDEDIRLMLDAGLNVVRIAEFAWSSMEPEEGRFELGWLHRVVDKLGAAGIATIMCTPSCTPPAWLTAKYPEVVVVNHAGVRADHGFRRHVCPNNPVYRELCARVAMKLAEAFGHDERVIGWQIDNEVDLWEGWGCYCPVYAVVPRRAAAEVWVGGGVECRLGYERLEPDLSVFLTRSRTPSELLSSSIPVDGVGAVPE